MVVVAFMNTEGPLVPLVPFPMRATILVKRNYEIRSLSIIIRKGAKDLNDVDLHSLNSCIKINKDNTFT